MTPILRPGFLLLPLICAGITPAPAQETPPPVRVDRAAAEELAAAWRPLFRGIDRLALEAEEPLRLRGQALRIDLREPGVSFLVAPSNGERPLECDSVTTSHFLGRHGLQAAINAAPFSPVVGEEGVPQDVVGLAISRGETISEPHAGYGALLITARNEARIVEQPPASLEGVENACGGFRVILDDGRYVGPKDDPRHPRSAAGVSRDGRYLYLLVIDGRQPMHSLGATQAEVADWLLRLGAHSGLNLDGGGSSSLVVAGPAGEPRILNRPIHAGKPGRERPCPNHLGVLANPLDADARPEEGDRP